MVSGGYKKSIIDKQNLGFVLRELRAKGYPYRAMIEHIYDNYHTSLNQMQISRWFLRNDRTANREIKDTSTRNLLYEIEKDAISANKDALLHALDDLESKIKRELDSTEMEWKDRNRIKGILKEGIKEVKRIYIDVRERTVSVCRYLYQLEDSINALMIDFSKEFCPKCRRHVSETIKENERVTKRYDNGSIR